MPPYCFPTTGCVQCVPVSLPSLGETGRYEAQRGLPFLLREESETSAQSALLSPCVWSMLRRVLSSLPVCVMCVLLFLGPAMGSGRAPRGAFGYSRFTVGQLFMLRDYQLYVKGRSRAGLGASYCPPASLLVVDKCAVRTSQECQNRPIYRGWKPHPVNTRFTVGR